MSTHITLATRTSAYWYLVLVRAFPVWFMCLENVGVAISKLRLRGCHNRTAVVDTHVAQPIQLQKSAL